MTAKDIQHHLDRHYAPASRFVVPNVYFFGDKYCETDFLVVKNGNGFIYDIEVKVSRSDFKADFKKKEKHEILETGHLVKQHKRFVSHPDGGGQFQMFEPGEKVPAKRPNRFYYAVPDGLVKVHEIPFYAGLLYVNENGVVNKVKEAPILHKDKMDVEKVLCNKFYYAFRELRSYNERNGISELKNKISKLDKGNDKLITQAAHEGNRNVILEAEIKILFEKMKTIKQVAIEPVYVEFMPRRGELQDNRFYISKKYKTALHLCLCGCKQQVITPLSSLGWKLTENNKGVSLSPSVGNYNLDCKSHYIITNNVANFV